MLNRVAPLIAICGISIAFQAPPNDAAAERERDVYKIYSLLLTNPQTSHGPDNNARYLIQARTSVPFDAIPLDRCIQPPKDREPEVKQALADFERRKSTIRTLEPKFSISKPYQLLDSDAIGKFQSARFVPGYQLPADVHFEGASDLFSFTDVYFSDNGRLALTRISTVCGGLCGMTVWKVLEKNAKGEWHTLPWVTCFGIS